MGSFRLCLLGTLIALSFRPAVAQNTGHEQALKVAQSVSDSCMWLPSTSTTPKPSP